MQGQQGLRITEPPPTKPDRVKPGNDTHPSIFDDPWNDDDTQPGLGPVVKPPQQEKQMAAKIKEVERTNLMFVFGRYRSGFNLNLVVARDKGYKGKAQTLPEFKLLNINNEFPIVVPGGKTAVIGEVYEIKLRTFDFMDELEECPSTQWREIISLDNGMRAQIYFLPKHKAPNREEEITSGDWAEWKRTEKARERDKKEKFIAMMAKGKAEAALRREQEEREAALAAARNVTSSRVSNPTNHPGRLWDPIRGHWETIQPGAAVKTETQATLYPGKNGKKVIHVSEVDVDMLRARLTVDGHSVPSSDSSVRAKVMSLYGLWFEID